MPPKCISQARSDWDRKENEKSKIKKKKSYKTKKKVIIRLLVKDKSLRQQQKKLDFICFILRKSLSSEL